MTLNDPSVNRNDPRREIEPTRAAAQRLAQRLPAPASREAWAAHERVARLMVNRRRSVRDFSHLKRMHD